MKERIYRLNGVSPLVMHNEQLCDPLNRWAKAVAEISSKRKKTEDDLREMSRREWMGGLYHSKELGVHVPERCLEAMLRDAAKKVKRGKDVTSALIVLDPAKLDHDGPDSPDELWDAGGYCLRASVSVNRSRVIRSRPRFPTWSLAFIVNYDETVLQASDIDGFLEMGGRLIGIGDWRPKYGRFTFEVIA